MTRKCHTVLLVAAALFSGAAAAATVTECITDVQLAKNDINAATTFVNAKDRVGLSGKADSAMQKLDTGKFADAALVLSDMSAKVSSLVTAAKPKLGATDGATISADIAAAQTCVSQLMTQ